MTQHLTVLESFGRTTEGMANQISGLRYDELADLFEMLSRKIAADAQADNIRGRQQLFKKLWSIAHQLNDIALTTEEVWKICKPHM